MNNINEEQDYDEIEQELNHFNWGAFMLSFIWGIGNKNFIPCIPVLILFFMPFLLADVIALFYCIWIGKNANKWAWENCQWKNIEHFRKVQKKWAIAGICVISFFAVIFPILLTAGIFALGKSNLGKSNLETTIDFLNCKRGVRIFKETLLQVNPTSNNFYQDFANIINNKENTKVQLYDNHYILTITTAQDKQNNVDMDIINNPPCSISKGNCYMEVKMRDEQNNTCRYYYDNNGKTARSKKTDAFINRIKKGKNIISTMAKGIEKEFYKDLD